MKKLGKRIAVMDNGVVISNTSIKKMGKRKLRARAIAGQKGFMEKTTPEWRHKNAIKAAKARWGIKK